MNQDLREHWPALHNTNEGMPAIIPKENLLWDGGPVAKNIWTNCNTTGPKLRKSKLTGLHYKQTNAQFQGYPRSASTL